MSRNNLSKSQIFLMEFIIVVLFFAICVTICVAAFVKADTVSKDTEQLNRAVILAQSGAEAIKSSWHRETGLPADVLETVGLEPVGYGDYIGFYDEEFQDVNREAAIYSMTADIELKKGMMTADIKVISKEEDEQIYSVQIKKYMAEGF